MSSHTALEVDSISKRYRLGEFGVRSLTEDVSRRWGRLRGKNVDVQFDANGRELEAPDTSEFWALKNVSFEVSQGDIVGLIGHNGSGKSTLLKILSRVTTPTKGRVRGRGRVSSLLEVGTGFHPELTGRENIYLNGAIMGMSRLEINRRLDEIVDFSGCGRHIETPVKRYSSGMVVRLGFAVAAHLDCEIMIVDEVLAVGDLAFQTRALEKMKSVSVEEGRTILFVSHNLRTIQDFCSSALVMNHGELTGHGSVDEAVLDYVEQNGAVTSEASFPKRNTACITGLQVDQIAASSGSLVVDITYSAPAAIQPTPGIVVYGEDLAPVLGSNNRMHAPVIAMGSAEAGCLRCRIDSLPLHEGRYFISAWLGDGDIDVDSVAYAVAFDFVPDQRHTPKPSIANIGPVNVPGVWSSPALGSVVF